MDQLKDEKIIEAILKGDVDRYNLLVERYKSYVYTIAFNILKSPSDAEEVAQDAFVKAYKNLAKFKKDSKFSTWLYRIAFNSALTAKRKLDRFTNVAFDNQLHSPADFQLSNNETADRRIFIAQAMEGLMEADRTALTLFYFDDLSLEEICVITEISLSSLKVRLHRARKRFAKQLQLILKDEALSL